jgi:hypothetical protein
MNVRHGTPRWAADGGNGSVVDMDSTSDDRSPTQVTDRLIEAYDLWLGLPRYEKSVMWLLIRAEMQDQRSKSKY